MFVPMPVPLPEPDAPFKKSGTVTGAGLRRDEVATATQAGAASEVYQIIRRENCSRTSRS